MQFTQTHIGAAVFIGMILIMACSWMRARQAMMRREFQLYVLQHCRVGEDIWLNKMAACLFVSPRRIERYIRREAMLRSRFVETSYGNYCFTRRGQEAYQAATKQALGYVEPPITANGGAR